ncbi:Receptor-like protein kinase THESEUS [Dirofilaria immitis]
MLIKPINIWLCYLIFALSDIISGQLHNPLSHYIEGRLGNRKIWWCPSGYGYLAYCPQPTDWDSYNWCCTWPYLGSWKPSCCPFVVPTGALIAIIIASIVLVALLIFLSCWCCFCCPLYKQLYDTDEKDYDAKR